jgi:hypothetical protein
VQFLNSLTKRALLWIAEAIISIFAKIVTFIVIALMLALFVYLLWVLVPIAVLVFGAAIGFAIQLQIDPPFATEGVLGVIALFLHNYAVAIFFISVLAIMFMCLGLSNPPSNSARYDDNDDGPNGLQAQAEAHERFHTQIYEMEQTHGSRND